VHTSLCRSRAVEVTTIPLTAEWDRIEFTDELVSSSVLLGFVTFADVPSSGRFWCEHYLANGPHI